MAPPLLVPSLQLIDDKVFLHCECFRNEIQQCEICRQTKDEHLTLLCDGCDQAYHMYCLQPPLTTVPEGEWFCTRCSAQLRTVVHDVLGTVHAQVLAAASPAEISALTSVSGVCVYHRVHALIVHSAWQEMSTHGRGRISRILSDAQRKASIWLLWLMQSLTNGGMSCLICGGGRSQAMRTRLP